MRAGLERLQQLLDALTDDGQIVRQHVYRVNNDTDAFFTLQRLDNRPDEPAKHILVDLPTHMTEQLLNRQVVYSTDRYEYYLTSSFDCVLMHFVLITRTRLPGRSRTADSSV